jgi:hypothetical protein
VKPTHDAVVVAADIEPANIVGHDEEDVRLLGFCGLRHLRTPLSGVESPSAMCLRYFAASGLSITWNGTHVFVDAEGRYCFFGKILWESPIGASNRCSAALRGN